ncbi:DNA polymerase [Streptomyces radicis]|uniref:DNA polymerase I n=1 Tax=Streptomyces radicis TaxID=1750517 RepID=A0A3A9WA93_9ACTN|nr:DNA polymerase [Streptomyces radicis]RKN09629.1 DNA polymerase [Streptomyces radicis]
MRTYRHIIAGDTITVRVPENNHDLDEFDQWASSLRGPVALDTETSGLDIYSPQFRLRTVQFGTAREAWVIHWEKGGAFRGSALRALRNAEQLLIHNAPFDWLVLDHHAGVTLESIAPRTTDTRILSALIDPRQAGEGGTGHALKPLSARWVDPAAPDTQEGLTEVFRAFGWTKATGWARISIDHPTYNLYAGLDTVLTARLAPVLRAELRRLDVPDQLTTYEHELARICAQMQRTGIELDQQYTRQLVTRLGIEAQEHADQARRYGVESVNSTAQIAEALTAMGETLTERTKNGALKVDKPVLLSLADLDDDWNRIGARTPNALAVAVLKSKRAGKWRQTYGQTFLETVDENSRVHPSINSLQARTGRMSATRPALQTLPSSDFVIRRALLADEGHVMLSADFKAVELRVLAALADVAKMKEAIDAGADLHGFTALQVFGPNYTEEQRDLCKSIGFGKVYGGGTLGISRMSGAPVAAVQRAIDAYDRTYPEVRRASKRWQREARNAGFVYVSPTGRRLPVDRDKVYAVTNYLCQSTARDVLGQALIQMDDAGLTPHLRLPIHDEVLASVPTAAAPELAREIERAMSFPVFGVPMEANAKIGGRSWGSLYGADY